jgi:hypothetical protein
VIDIIAFIARLKKIISETVIPISDTFTPLSSSQQDVQN